MSNTPNFTSSNFDSINADFQDNHPHEENSEDFIRRNLNDNDEIDNNNQQPETGINMTNNLVSFINEEPNNENSSENTLKKSQNSFISKKRRKTKTPNKTKEKENKNKKGKNSHQDNSIKEAIKALLLIIKIIIEIFGNITLPDFDSNDFVGGTLQNEILCRSKMYQIFAYKDDYKKILENAEPNKPEDEKKFNYFLTRNFEELFKEYYNNNKNFLIEGKYETIDLFRTFREEIKRRKEKVYELDDEKKKEEKINNFIEASKLIFNNFKGCKGRHRASLKHYDKIKIDRFDNYLKHNLIKKESDEKSLIINLDESKSEDSIESRKDINDSQSKNDEILSGFNSDNNNNYQHERNSLGEYVSFGYPSLRSKTTNYEDNNVPSPINTQNYEISIFKKGWNNGVFNEHEFIEFELV